MKTLSRLFSAAFILFAAVSCGTKEIDHPDIPDTPQDSEITITASIIQTRVSYDCSDPGEVKQEWEVGDILFGFYGRSTSHQIVFRVSGVNTTTGVATLKAVSGADWIEEETVGGTAVDLVYTGGEAIFTDNGIDVDLSEQTLSRVPGCMHAQATLQIDGDGKKSLEFYFQNDCALIEIDSLTGFVEDWPGGSEISLDLSSVHITNLLLGGSYSFRDGELFFESDEGPLDDYGIDLEPGWAVGKDGDVSGPHGEKILIAVAPNPVENEINVSAEKTSEMGTIQYPSYTYGKRSLAGGLCYVISAQPVVAKTADGQCFKSVSAAFDHAEALSGQGYNTASKNVVTLIKKEIDGFGEQTASQTHRSSIDIDYPVTLDLNGCTLSLSVSEYFDVTLDFSYKPGILTITDSNGLNDDEKYEGNIESTSSNPIIINCGDVIIDGGGLYFTFSDESYYERYSMIENEGGTITINNHSFLQAEGDSEVNTEHFLIKNYYEGEVNINNGDLYSYDAVNTIYNLKGTVTMSGGELYSRNEDAILNEADGIVNIVDGDIDSGGYYSIENRGKVTISGGNIYKYEDNAQVPNNDNPTIYNTNQLIVSGGIISSSLNYAVYCNGGSIEMSDGEISCSHLYSGALVLNDAGNSSISGGTLTCSGKSTISITGTSTLDVSGGKIICTGQDSAIEIDARDPEKIKSPTLTVRWPGNDVKDQPSGVYKPFLYSPKRAPIYENSSHTDHFSTVYIKGGFLYTGTSAKYFYKSDNSNTALQATSGYCFYSNVSSLHTYASGVKASNTSLSSAITIDASTHGVPGVTTGLSFSNKISIVAK